MLDDAGQMPAYRDQVREVITPKFAADFDKEVATAEQLVAQAGITRTADVFATASPPSTTTPHRRWSPARSPIPTPRGGRTPAVDQQPLPFRFAVDPGDDRRRVAGRRLQPRDQPGRRAGEVSDARVTSPAGTTCSTCPRRLRRGDPRGLEGHDRRPRARRPPLRLPQPRRRGAARPDQPGGVRRNARPHLAEDEPGAAEPAGAGAPTRPSFRATRPHRGVVPAAGCLAGLGLSLAAAPGRLRLPGCGSRPATRRRRRGHAPPRPPRSAPSCRSCPTTSQTSTPTRPRPRRT